jgi:hypothetical protein
MDLNDKIEILVANGWTLSISKPPAAGYMCMAAKYNRPALKFISQKSVDTLIDHVIEFDKTHPN